MFPNEKIYYILKNVQPENMVDLDFNVVEASSPIWLKLWLNLYYISLSVCKYTAFLEYTQFFNIYWPKC